MAPKVPSTYYTQQSIAACLRTKVCVPTPNPSHTDTFEGAYGNMTPTQYEQSIKGGGSYPDKGLRTRRW